MSRFIISILFILVAFPSAAQSLDMEKGSLKDLSAWVSVQSGKNILLGPGVDATLSIYCPEVLPGEEYQVFKNAVMSAGFVLVESGNYSTVMLMPVVDPALVDQVNQERLFHVYTFKNISVDQVSQALSKSFDSDSSVALIEPIPGTNSIIIKADQFTINSVVSLASVLDVRRQQVHIEAVIYETREGDAENLGADLTAQLNLGSFSVGFNSDMTGSAVLSPGGSVLLSHTADLNLLIQALESSDNTRLLSTPSIVVSNSELARISVGQNVPFITGSTNIDGTAQPVQTVERHDVGVSLQVRPFILHDGSIDLTVTQVSSSVSTSTIASDLITNQRSITTRLLVQDQQYVMLGGLIGEEQREEIKRVPVLGSIPFLGVLFRSSSTETVRTRLNVVLRVTKV